MAANKESVVEELTRPIVKLLLALVGLFFIRFIVVRLPGLGTRVPETPIPFAALAGSIITLIMAAIIINFGREIEPRLQRTVSGPPEIVADLAASVKFIAFLVAVFIVYDGLAPTLVPFLIPDPGLWVYDVVFLLVALVPTILIAQNLFGNLEEITDILTQQVKSATVDEVDCPNCSETIRSSLDYCSNCGEDISSLPENESGSAARTNVCPECESYVSEDRAFCGSCGTEVQPTD